MKKMLLAALLVLAPVREAPADWKGAMSDFDKGNFAAALKEFSSLAQKGHPAAQNNLGVFYANGKLVSKNSEMAAKWYLLAAEQGLAIAQVNMGHLYEVGEGVEQDILAAMVWYRLAADQGDDLAQFYIGRLKAEGTDGQSDDLSAYTWLSLAIRSTKDETVKADAQKVRNGVSRRMSRQQIKEAESLIAAWKAQN